MFSKKKKKRYTNAITTHQTHLLYFYQLTFHLHFSNLLFWGQKCFRNIFHKNSIQFPNINYTNIILNIILIWKQAQRYLIFNLFFFIKYQRQYSGYTVYFLFFSFDIGHQSERLHYKKKYIYFGHGAKIHQTINS